MPHAVAHIKTFLHSRLFRVGIIGLTGVGVQTLIFEILGIYLKVVAPSTAAIIGGEVAILTNFFLNHHFSFRDRTHHGNPYMRLVRFHMVVAGSLLFQWTFVFLTERVTSSVFLIHAAYLAGIGVGFLTNYAGYYFFVWKHPKKDQQENLAA